MEVSFSMIYRGAFVHPDEGPAMIGQVGQITLIDGVQYQTVVKKATVSHTSYGYSAISVVLSLT